MRQSWTDDRLDEFGRRIDERFDRIEMEMKEGNRALRADFDALRQV